MDIEKTSVLEGQVPGLESQSNAEQLPLLRRVRARLQMIVLFLAGVILAVGNHFYNEHLSGRPVGSHAYHGYNLSQEISGAISNALAIALQTAFVAAIGVALVQRFWYHIHVKNLEAKDIGALYSTSSGNSFSPSSIPSWWIATTFSLFAFTTTVMTLVPVIAPGALTVSLSRSFQPCLVNTSLVEKAQLSSYYTTGGTAEYLHNPHIQALAVANSVVTSGSPLTPPSPCGVCSYDVSFVGAAMECSNLTATYDFGPWLNVANWPANSAPLWSGTFTKGTNITLLVTMQDGNIAAMRQSALLCTAYLANYTVEVNHQDTTSTVTVKNVTVGEILNPTLADPDNADPIEMQLNGLAAAVGTLLAGNVTYRATWCEYVGTTSELESSPPPISFSPFLRQIDCDNPNTSSFEWVDMMDNIPAMMTNASISLLSGAYASSGHNYLTEIATVCNVQSLTYSYYPLRMLLTYGVAACVTAFCILVGFHTIIHRRKEETLDYHRLVDAISRNELPST